MSIKTAVLSTILYSLLSASGIAQITFSKSLGGSEDNRGNTAIITEDNGYLIIGSTNYPNSANDIILIKFDSLFNVNWTKSFGNSYNDNIYSVMQTNDGGYILGGSTSNGVAGYQEAYLVKIDSLGNTQWAKSYGGSNIDYGYFVQQTSDGGYILCGETDSYNTSNGAGDCYIVKTDNLGNVVWSKTYGKANQDLARRVFELPTGEFMIFGFTTIPFSSNSAILVIKTNMNGDSLWTKTLQNTGKSIGISDIYQTLNNEFLTVGGTGILTVNGNDAYVMKLNSNGDTLWTKVFSDVNSEYFTSISETNDGNLILSGRSNSFNSSNQYDIFIMKTDSLANPIWTKYFNLGSNSNSSNILSLNDGGYLITGSHIASQAPLDNNLLLIKTDSLGNSSCGASIISLTEMPASIVIGHLNLAMNSGYTVTALQIDTNIIGNMLDLCNPSGINEDTTENGFIMFPNPSYGRLTIRFNNKLNSGKLEILDINGAAVFETPLLCGSHNYEVELFMQGFYLIKVSERNKCFYRKLLVLPN